MSELSNISNIKEILSRHGFNFSKSMGQNFLINPNICPKMARSCGVTENDAVLEIGPGIGVLTFELASLANKVVSVELDKRLIPVLDETLHKFKNVKIINSDILKTDIKGLIDKEFPNQRVFVCANLPYYITSPVIMKLLEEKLPIESITVMVQKEAAERICAEPGSRNSGAISLAVRYYSDPKILFNVSRGSFLPAPNVDSAVIKLNLLKNPHVSVKNEKLLFDIIKASFSKRRKTILNSLSAGLSLPKKVISGVLDASNITNNLRAEQLTLEDFAVIANNLYSIKEGEKSTNEKVNI